MEVLKGQGHTKLLVVKPVREFRTSDPVPRALTTLHNLLKAGPNSTDTANF